MLSELTALFDVVPPHADLVDYTTAIVDDNALGKQTSANRRLTGQRLRELYGLDSRLPLFRVLRKLWYLDELGKGVIRVSKESVLRLLNRTTDKDKGAITARLSRTTGNQRGRAITASLKVLFLLFLLVVLILILLPA